MANLLHQTRVASTVDEGRELVPYLGGMRIDYSDNSYLEFSKVLNLKGKEGYRIEARLKNLGL